MANKLGRNDLCPCGSNKKYKKCCMPSNPSITSGETLDFIWHKLRQTEGEVIDKHLIPYITKEIPEEAITAALNEFYPGNLPEAMDEELVFDRFFIPWLLFNWIPVYDFGIKHFNPEKTIAQNYIEVHAERLDGIKRQFIEAMRETFYSFYSVQEVEPEKRLIVQDILLGTVHTIKEKLGTRTLKRGDIVFSRILTLDNQSIFIGMAPYTIPVSYQNELIDYKQWLIEENENRDLDAFVLREYFTPELVDYFFEIMEESYNKPLLTLQNTDGEPILFSQSYFNLAISPSEALKKLLPLTLSKDIKEFAGDAVYDSSGEIARVEFPWLKKGNKQHKHWNNTVMGNISLEGDKLILETNSVKRTEQGKKLLSKYLGHNITFQRTVTESPEQAAKAMPNTYNENQIESGLLQLPEVQEQLKAMAKSHWENWFDEPIPALNNKTPREAAKTKLGREKLEALLLEYEYYNSNTTGTINLFKADINYIKRELQL